MAIERANVQKLMEWLAEGGRVRSANPSAKVISDKLAVMLFQRQLDWARHPERIDVYLPLVRKWFAADRVREVQFIERTGPQGDPRRFLEWFTPVLAERERQAAQEESENLSSGEQAGPSTPSTPRATLNPNFDSTPGTEYFRYIEATKTHLFAATENSSDWATYEQRRYTEPSDNADYGLRSRYDRRDKVYEWYDASARQWRDQAWADRYAQARRAGTGAQTTATGQTQPQSTQPQSTQPQWDQNWNMFYRVRSDGVYEFADARTRGDRSSGSSDVWLTRDELLARSGGASQTTTTQNAQQPISPEELERNIEAEINAAVAEISGADQLTPEELEEIKAELRAEFSTT